MIEIITKKVDMPPINEREYQKISLDSNGRKWAINDKETGNVIFKGNFEDVTFRCYYMNKKYYTRQNNPETTQKSL